MKDFWMRQTGNRIPALKAIGCLAVLASLFTPDATAAPLDPLAFESLGVFDPEPGTHTIITSGAPRLYVGSTVYTGVVHSQGAGLPEIAVFAFDGIRISSGVHIEVYGSLPVAILSHQDFSFAGETSISAMAGQAGGYENGGPGVGQLSSNGLTSGGAGFGGRGGDGETAGIGGAAYGNLLLGLEGGSAAPPISTGPGSFLLGGAGGGAIELGAIGLLQLDPATTIQMSGSNGGTFRERFVGGGSGGAVLMHGATVIVPSASQIIATGGDTDNDLPAANPNTGGGGGGGRVAILLDHYIVGTTQEPVSAIDVSGGVARFPTSNGHSGHIAVHADRVTVPTGQVFDFLAWRQQATMTTDELLINANAIAAHRGDYENAGQVTINDDGLFAIQGLARASGQGEYHLAGGTLSASGGIQLDTVLTSVSGFGNVIGPVSTSGGAIIRASGGVLSIGDANRADGVALNSRFTILDGATLVLNDADTAYIRGGSMGEGSKLAAFGAIQLAVGASLNAPSGAVIAGHFINGGRVVGPTASNQALTFNDAVSGAGSYTGNVRFEGGFSPGNSAAAVSLDSATFAASNTLTMELGGTSFGSGYDHLTFSGAAELGGKLKVQLIDGFLPSIGIAFDLFDWSGVTGNFASVELPALPEGVYWNQSQLLTSGKLLVGESIAGDFNNDGLVDAADYTVWRDRFGAIEVSLAHGTGDGSGMVDQGDHDVWRANYGASITSDALAQIPEPTAGVIALAASMLIGMARRQGR